MPSPFRQGNLPEWDPVNVERSQWTLSAIPSDQTMAESCTQIHLLSRAQKRTEVSFKTEGDLSCEVKICSPTITGGIANWP